MHVEDKLDIRSTWKYSLLGTKPAVSVDIRMHKLLHLDNLRQLILSRIILSRVTTGVPFTTGR